MSETPLPSQVPRNWSLTPFRLALAYLLVAFVGLVLSDIVLPLVLQDPLLRVVQSLKGAIEILLTAIFIYVVMWLGWRDLQLKERAIDEAPIGITISDPDQKDNPLIFANQRFSELTGYESDEVIGRNCRFLQGDETDPETRATLREAIDDERPVSADIRNYRKNGEMFWNSVDIAPVRDDDGTVTNYVGFQTNITDRKITEERLGVMNRILRHNCRNRLTVISGYLDLLRDDVDDADHDALEQIEGAVDDLISLIEDMHETRRVIQETASTGPVPLDDRLNEMVDAYRDQYPAATLTLTLPDGSCSVAAEAVVTAVDEAIENALEHTDATSPEVTIDVTTPRDDWITITIEDNGPGIPDDELTVLAEGETVLTHGTRLGLWTIHWAVESVGGSLSVSTDETGTRLIITVPTTPPRRRSE